MKRYRFLSLLTSLILILTLLPAGVFTVCAVGTTVDLSTLTSTYTISDSGTYTFTGSGSYGISVTSGSPTIIFSNAEISVGSGSAISIAGGGTITIEVEGNCTAESNSYSVSDNDGAGVYVAQNSSVIITAKDRSSTLTARAGKDGAGIGGCGWSTRGDDTVSCGNITIRNVTVYAYASSSVGVTPGIGARKNCGNITIENATVYAYGMASFDYFAPAIGICKLSYNGTLGEINISGVSEVYAYRGAYKGNSNASYIGDMGYRMQAAKGEIILYGGSITNSVVYYGNFNAPLYGHILTGETYESTDSDSTPYPIMITSQPQSVGVNYGYTTSPTFTVEASGDNLTYQWYKDSVISENAISGATNKTYYVPTNLEVGTYKYKCVIQSNGYYLATDEVTLTVKSPFSQGGAGTADSPYLISNAAELSAFRDLVNKGNTSICGKLTADIDLSGVDNWTPIGVYKAYNNSSNLPYKGTFDGDYHVIKNMKINSGLYGVGLFSYIESATIKNLGVVDSDVTSTYATQASFTGGICGYAEGKSNNRSNISNCYYTGKVTGNGAAGGVCGHAKYLNVTNCYNAGDVSGGNVGGVCAWADDVIITDCYNTGTVTSKSKEFNSGGIRGSSNDGDDKITNCFNTGTVSGGYYNGSICGNNDGTISNCYYLTGTASKGVGDGTDNTTELTIADIEGKTATGLLAKLNENAGENNGIWNTKLSSIMNWQYGKPVIQPVFAYQTSIYRNEPSYTVTIPKELTIGDTMTITYSGAALLAIENVSVTISDIQPLEYQKEPSVTLNYTINGQPYDFWVFGEEVFNFNNTNPATPDEHKLSLTAELEEGATPKYAGDYQGTVTFNIKLTGGDAA